MADEALLEELLSLWQREAERGRDLPATELCRDHPGLSAELQRRIQAVRQMNGLRRAGAETLTRRMRDSRPGTPPQSAAPPPAVPGYEILGELGRGGMGVVYKARQLGLNRVVALKMILAGGHAGPDELARFRTEGEAVARIQHPHIVQIHEVGEHEGRPFFSLEFCPGGSLEDKLRGTPLLPREAAALVEVLARAMQAAHAKGVVHRDLKPANVLLGEDGTPKVTDFGLAKKLDEAGQTAIGAVMGTPSYMAPEQAGYKPHAPIGPAADVYALGAILYELLTGRPPFNAATVLDTLKQVVADEPVPPRQLQSRTPRDLETVCLKCLQKEPAKRYASAHDLAEDLRRFQAGEPIRARPVGRLERGWRWCRRNPVVATLAASLCAVIIGSFVALAALWLRADRERQQALANLEQANRNLQLAQEAVDRNCTEISEETLLNEPGLQPLRKRLLQGSRDFYQRFIEQRPGDPALRAGLAAAYQRLATITFAIGNKEEAISHQQEAVRLYEALWGEDHDSASVQQNLALAYSNLGSIYLQLDQLGPAEGALRRSLDLGDQLVTAHPDSPTHLAQLLPVLSGLGLLHLKKGNVHESEKLLTRARELIRQLAAANHDSATGIMAAKCLINLGVLFNQAKRPGQAVPLLEQVRSQLSESMKQHPGRLDVADAQAACLANLGVAYRLAGRADDAEKTYQQAEDILKELAAKNPSVTSYQLDRASNLYNLGNAYRTSNRLPKAEECYKQAQAMQERLVADYPSLAQSSRDLSQAYTNLAVIYAQLGRRDEAERMYQKNLETREQLCKEKPDILDYQVLLAKTLGNVAGFYREGGQVKEAEAAYRRKTTIYERLIKNDPGNSDYECSLGLTYNDLGRLYRPVGRMAEAEAAYLQALALQEKLAREYPKVADYRVDLATTQNNLGNLYRQTGQEDKAEDYYRTAIRGHEALVHDYPEEPYYARELARSYNGRAALLFTAGRLADAEPLLRQAADLLGKLVEKQPEVLAYRYERAENLINLCEVYNRTQRHAEAESLCKEVLPPLERLARENPKFVMLAYVLGSAQGQMGQAVAVPGRDPGEAVGWYGRAITTLGDAARKAPENDDIREVLVAAHQGRAKQLLKLARDTAALRDLDRAAELSPKPGLPLTLARVAVRVLAQDHAGTAARADELASRPGASAFLAYSAACANARSAAIVREDGRLSPSEKGDLSERYAARAVEWLRKARAAGYFRVAAAVEALKTESDLDALRDRDDFQKWLSES